MGLIAAACLWGVAEASFFFIVPDVLLTLLVLRRDLRFALRACAVAAFGAIMAGLGLYLWAAQAPDAAAAAMLRVPAVGSDLVARVRGEFDSGWPWHLLLGAVRGVPYKLYAVEAGRRGIALPLFLAVSFCARLARFALTCAIAALGRRLLPRSGWAIPIWAMVWIAVYVLYWHVRGLI